MLLQRRLRNWLQGMKGVAGRPIYQKIGRNRGDLTQTTGWSQQAELIAAAQSSHGVLGSFRLTLRSAIGTLK